MHRQELYLQRELFTGALAAEAAYVAHRAELRLLTSALALPSC